MNIMVFFLMIYNNIVFFPSDNRWMRQVLFQGAEQSSVLFLYIIIP